MKKILIVLAVSLLALSCEKEIEQDEVNAYEMTTYIHYTLPEHKRSVTVNGHGIDDSQPLEVTTGDVIRIFGNSNFTTNAVTGEVYYHTAYASIFLDGEEVDYHQCSCEVFDMTYTVE